jgi:hypothetical protein
MIEVVILRFLKIAERLIEFSAAIFVHGLPAARGGKDVLKHLIERLRTVPSGTDGENLQIRPGSRMIRHARGFAVECHSRLPV